MVSSLERNPRIATPILLIILAFGFGLLVGGCRSHSDIPVSSDVEDLETEAVTEAIQAGIKDLIPDCESDLYLLHTMTVSRILSFWEKQALRFGQKCGAFRVVAAKPYPPSGGGGADQDQWCIKVSYSYLTLSKEWAPAEIAILISKIGDGWAVRRGSWLQPPGQDCAQFGG